MTKPVTVLFIAGLGRSGSTIFELSLGTDPRVVSLGEVIHLWKRSLIGGELCGCGRAFAACSFWHGVGAEAFGGWENVDAHRVFALKRSIDRTLRVPQLATRVGTPAWRAQVLEYASYYGRLYRAVATVSGRAVLVDSSKQVSLPYVLAYAKGIDLRVVHCLRDPRAVAYSWSKRVARPESTGGRDFMDRYPPALTAVKWLQHNGVLEALRVRGVPTTRVRYEDWVRAPQATVAATLAFAGRPPAPNPALGRDWVELGTNHTCSGNPMRFTQGRVSIRRDDAWRAHLPPTQRRLVTGLTAPGLAAYGYLRRRQ